MPDRQDETHDRRAGPKDLEAQHRSETREVGVATEQRFTSDSNERCADDSTDDRIDDGPAERPKEHFGRENQWNGKQDVGDEVHDEPEP